MNALETIVREEIRASGPMRFDRFMQLALYHPQHGYYAMPRKIGRAGDFYTSVSVGPLFGRLLARQARQMAELLDEPVFRMVEQGAHDGQLARDILEECRRWPAFFDKLRYLIVERSTTAREVQQERLAEFGGRVSWLDDIRKHHGEKPAGVLISNELVDAMPVRVVERIGGAWHERRVRVDESGSLAWTPSPIEDSNLKQAVEQLPATANGCRYEIGMEARRWMREVSTFFRRGYVLTIDYGLPAPEFYVAYPAGTLTCYRQHRRGDDVLLEPGSQDITAHVEFTSLARAAEPAGWQTLALVDQQRFLTGLLQGDDRELDAKEVRAFQTLTHPEHLGARFKVLVQARDAPGGLDGLRFARAGGLD